MTITSYAQNFEDVILWRALKHLGRGFYIDVGAQDPVVDSVSLAFYEKGWRGVHVEPNSQYAQKLRDARPDEQVIDAVIGRNEGEIPFFEVQDTGLSTGDESIAQAHEARGFPVKRVMKPCRPLSAILDIYKDQEVHWLKIDVEGMECSVIESWKPSQVRPWIVVVEATQPLSAEQDSRKWEPKLKALGYKYAYFDGLNRFYVSNAHPELMESFGPGPNVFDNFALSGSASAPFCRKVQAEGRDARERDTKAAFVAAPNAAFVAEVRDARAALEAELQNARAALEAEVRDARAALEAKIHHTSAASSADAQRIQTALESRLGEAQQAEAELRAQISQIYASTSWWITAPLRRLKGAISSRGSLSTIFQGAHAWVTFKPGSRPRRFARRIAQRTVLLGLNFLRGHPIAHATAKRVLKFAPTRVSNRLRGFALAQADIPTPPPKTAVGPRPHGPHVQVIYSRLRGIAASSDYFTK